MSSAVFTDLHPCVRECFKKVSDDIDDDTTELETVDGDSLVFVQSVVSLLSSISQYCRLCDQIPQVRHDTVT